MNRISDISSTIASGVEEQSATTNEIGRYVRDASRGVKDICQNTGFPSRRFSTEDASFATPARLAAARPSVGQDLERLRLPEVC